MTLFIKFCTTLNLYIHMYSACRERNIEIPSNILQHDYSYYDAAYEFIMYTNPYFSK